MGRFLVLWRRSPGAPWPEDPVESSKLTERLWLGIDSLIEKGEIKEFGYFMDGMSGYSIGEGDSADTFKNVSMFSPYIECEVQEIISYEKAKGTFRALWKTIAEAMK